MDNTAKSVPSPTLVASCDAQVHFLPPSRTIQQFAHRISEIRDSESCDDAFYVCNLGQVFKQLDTWCHELPQVQPFYAVKCNNDPVLLRLLAKLGLNFDCASKGEIAQMLDLGVSADRIIYANPCKTRSHIRYAAAQGVELMTFDNENELYKIKELAPDARMVLRISVSDPSAVCQLNLKFGAEPVEKARALLKLASVLDIEVVGISFHVGSGCRDPTAFKDGIAHAASLFEYCRDNLGFEMSILDLGGGYPGFDDGNCPFNVIASVIRTALTQHFAKSEVKVIAEPGRYFAAAAYTLLLNVTSKSELTADQIDSCAEDPNAPAYMYYVNDGVYGSFNCILYDHVMPRGRPLIDKQGRDTLCSIWGPTCDSMDCISTGIWMPEMSVGDWLVYDNMGAYTVAAACEFNGFVKPEIIYAVEKAERARFKEHCLASVLGGDCLIQVDGDAAYLANLELKEANSAFSDIDETASEFGTSEDSVSSDTDVSEIV